MTDTSLEKAFFIDMDGVINKGNCLIRGADLFVEKLLARGCRFMFITNNSYHTRDDLQQRLARMGIDADREKFYTSAMATSSFIRSQKRGCRAYVIGGPGLHEELEKREIIITDKNPDYVILGETGDYDYRKITEAIHLINEGARFIATNMDITGPGDRGPIPACGALVAPIEKVTGVKPYFLGKPNPAMMYWARKKLNVHSRNSFMIGDRMDTDIVGGMESGMTCCLVLSGVTARGDVARFPYQPDYIFESVSDIDPDLIVTKWDR